MDAGHDVAGSYLLGPRTCHSICSNKSTKHINCHDRLFLGPVQRVAGLADPCFVPATDRRRRRGEGCGEDVKSQYPHVSIKNRVAGRTPTAG